MGIYFFATKVKKRGSGPFAAVTQLSSAPSRTNARDIWREARRACSARTFSSSTVPSRWTKPAYCAASTHIRKTPKDTREGQSVVDLVGEVTTPGAHDPGARGRGRANTD